MGLEVIGEYLNGLILFKPKVFGDERGFFMESYKQSEFMELGIPTSFKQDNHSKSAKGVLRGLHFQWDEPMGKLIRVTAGSAQVVEVDIRHNSPTFGKHKSFKISADNKYILWIPPGFANGFLSLEDDTELLYKCTAEWNPNAESGILWNDSKLGINWLISNPSLSGKDEVAQTFDEWMKTDESRKFNFS